jgi:hypothetical protein
VQHRRTVALAISTRAAAGGSGGGGTRRHAHRPGRRPWALGHLGLAVASARGRIVKDHRAGDVRQPWRLSARQCSGVPRLLRRAYDRLSDARHHLCIRGCAVTRRAADVAPQYTKLSSGEASSQRGVLDLAACSPRPMGAPFPRAPDHHRARVRPRSSSTARSDASNAEAGRPAEANGASSRRRTTCLSSTTTASLPSRPETRAAPSRHVRNRPPDAARAKHCSGISPTSSTREQHSVPDTHGRRDPTSAWARRPCRERCPRPGRAGPTRRRPGMTDQSLASPSPARGDGGSPVGRVGSSWRPRRAEPHPR